MSYATTDLSDAHPEAAVLEPLFLDFGGNIDFHGPAHTLKIHEDNTLVRAALEQPGEGKVLVVDGGGSMRCALLGDQLAELGVKNGWAGVLVDGCVRDVAELAECDTGIRALASMPLPTEKRNEGQTEFIQAVREPRVPSMKILIQRTANGELESPSGTQSCPDSIRSRNNSSGIPCRMRIPS